MTTKSDMLNQIETKLGSEGNSELAAAMFSELMETVLFDDYRALTFDPQDGFVLDANEFVWADALERVIAAKNA